MEAAVNEDRTYPELVREEGGAFTIPREQSSLKGIHMLWYRLTHWETWDWRIKYVLIAPAWLWFCLRARSLWFFTAANPTLTFGGFDGERKSEMYAQLPEGTFPRSMLVHHSCAFEAVLGGMRKRGLDFPIAVKPDAGKMGLMFRKIHSLSELASYHESICCDYIVQEWVSLPVEVSVFYYRMPGSDKGNISGFVRKDFLEVTGDGRSTLWQLITTYPRARFRLDEMRWRHRGRLDEVLKKGEPYALCPALNLSRGGKLVSLEDEKDQRLLRVFDDLSHYTRSFYFGRYDVKCASVEDLKQGKNFCILEYNGSGAEPHHVYGNGNSLWTACSILVAHWSILYRIARLNNRNGVPYWDLKSGMRFLKQAGRHLSALRKLDRETI